MVYKDLAVKDAEIAAINGPKIENTEKGLFVFYKILMKNSPAIITQDVKLGDGEFQMVDNFLLFDMYVKFGKKKSYYETSDERFEIENLRMRYPEATTFFDFMEIMKNEIGA